jgi:transcriptional regulator with GAF, ATPase, and Fis domain
MSMVPSKRDSEPIKVRQPVLDARLRRNWKLMVGVTIASTVGMAVAVAPVLGEQFGTLWPWPNTHLVLLGGLAVSVILLVAHLSVQQRRMSDIHGEIRCLEGAVQHLEEESIERERQNHARLKALLNISRMMGAVNQIDDVFESVIDTCIELFNAQQASLMILDPDTRELRVRAAKGHLDTEAVKAARPKVGEGIAGWVAKNYQPLVLGPDIDLSRHPGLKVDVSKLTAGIVVPVLLRGELIGVLSIRSRKPEVRFSEDDLQSLRVLAENIGTVVRHSEHVEWMRKTIEAQRSHAEHEPVG